MKDYLRIIGAVSIWAVINGYVIKGVNASPAAIGLWMGVVGCLICFIWFAINGINLKSLSSKAWWLLIGVGVFGGVYNVFFYTAIKMNKVANVALVHYLAQPISVIWLVIFLKEKLTGKFLSAMILGFLGIAVIAWNDGKLNTELWFIFAVFSAAFYSLEIVLSRALGTNNVEPMLSSFSKLLFQVISMTIGAALFGQALAVANSQILPIIIAGTLLYLSFRLIFKGLQKVSGKNFSILGYIDRLGAVAIGVIVFKEILKIGRAS